MFIHKRAYMLLTLCLISSSAICSESELVQRLNYLRSYILAFNYAEVKLNEIEATKDKSKRYSELSKVSELMRLVRTQSNIDSSGVYPINELDIMHYEFKEQIHNIFPDAFITKNRPASPSPSAVSIE